jgi:hypothetical protein
MMAQSIKKIWVFDIFEKKNQDGGIVVDGVEFVFWNFGWNPVAFDGYLYSERFRKDLLRHQPILFVKLD